MMRTLVLLWVMQMLTPLCSGQTPPSVVRLVIEEADHVKHCAPRWRAPGQRRIALSLRGGSAKGLAHIGVLQRFEEEGLPVDAITGTSAGAFVAALAASGFSGENQVNVFRRMDFGTLLDDRRRSLGLSLSEEEDRNENFLSVEITGRQADTIPGQERTFRVKKLLLSIFGHSFLTYGNDFDQMRIPIRIVATDLQTGDPWVFREGNLAEAVQASMTIPGLLVPPVVKGHQLVDGGLVENLPIAISRDAFPGMLQVGVDIGQAWDSSRVRNIPTLLSRSLDVSMRQNERRSQRAADLLISPITEKANDFDFHGQVETLVAAGRRAFDENLPYLEAQIYGPEGEKIAATQLLMMSPANDPECERIVQEALPTSGPILLKDIYRLLRRLYRRLPLVEAWVELPSSAELPARLYTRAQPLVRSVELVLPSGLHPEEIRRFRHRAAVPGLRPGDNFSPVALDACLAEFALYGGTPGSSYLRFTSPAFDPATGVLTLLGQGVRLEPIEVQPKELEAPFRRYFQDLEGQLLRPGDLLQRLDMARIRFGVSGFGSEHEINRTATGIRFKLFPKRESAISISLAPAYESSWGAHLGLGTEVRNPFGIPISIQGDGAIDSLQKRASLGIDREFTWLPGFGYQAYQNFSSQRFGDDLLLVEGPHEELKDLTIRHQGFSIGLWGRFGGDDRGMVRVGAEERRSSFTAGGLDSPRGLERTVQAAVEWDNLDFHALPTDGSMLRLRAGRSIHVENGIAPFEFAYARIRYLRRLPALPVSFDLDLETGLGWNTPVPRWNTLGGSGSIIGTRSAAYLLPNAAIARLGFPFTSVSVFGIGVQIVPRVDWGRFSLQPSELSRGPRIFGAGLVIRSILRNFTVEASLGKTESRGGSTPGSRKASEFTLLVGTRPFDLWRQR